MRHGKVWLRIAKVVTDTDVQAEDCTPLVELMDTKWTR